MTSTPHVPAPASAPVAVGAPRSAAPSFEAEFAAQVDLARAAELAARAVGDESAAADALGRLDDLRELLALHHEPLAG